MIDNDKQNLKNVPLSSVDNNILKSNDNKNSFKDIEEQRFTTYNPLLSNSIKFKRMYWSSKIEIIARLLLIIVSILILVFSYFLANNLVKNILSKTGLTIKSEYIIYIMMTVTLAFNFIFYLPLAIGRSASAMFGWAIVYVVMAISYFIILEVFCTVLLVINGLIDEAVTSEVPFFMIAILVITIVWLVASCLLIVKSDDVRKELSVE